MKKVRFLNCSDMIASHCNTILNKGNKKDDIEGVIWQKIYIYVYNFLYEPKENTII